MTLWLDGPMGTALYERGLSDVFAANLTQGLTVRDVHTSSVLAGAQAVLTNTFTAPIAFANDPVHAAECTAAALEHARGSGAAECYFSVGPLPVSAACITAIRSAHDQGVVSGTWLETFEAGDPLLFQWLEALDDIPTVVTVLARTPPSVVGHPERSARLLAWGYNCGTGDLTPPRSRPNQPVPFVWKPATKLLTAHLSVEQIAMACEHLAPDWIGLCCGGTPADLMHLKKALT